MPRRWAFLRVVFGRHELIDKERTVIRLIKDLAYEPVLLFTILTVGLTAAQAQIDNVWLNVATVVIVAVGGAITRFYTASKAHITETYGAKAAEELTPP